MVRIVKARTYIRPALAGGSQPIYIRADDGADYLLKSQNNPQGLQTLINEIIASNIARLIGAPTTDSVLIDVEPEFLEIANLRDLPVGLHFGSKYINGLIGPARKLLPDVANTDQFVHVITSDAVTNNLDRSNDGNFLVRIVTSVTSDSKRLEFIAVDFGHCFGGHWDEKIIEQVGNWCGDVVPEMTEFISGDDPFAEPVAASKRILKEVVNAIVDIVPTTWNLPEAKSTAIKQYLVERLQSAENLLEMHRLKFPKWTKKGDPRS